MSSSGAADSESISEPDVEVGLVLLEVGGSILCADNEGDSDLGPDYLSQQLG